MMQWRKWADAMRETVKLVLQKARAFVRAKRGNVAMMFAICLVPLTVAAGVGLDFAREAMVKNAMNEALDCRRARGGFFQRPQFHHRGGAGAAIFQRQLQRQLVRRHAELLHRDLQFRGSVTVSATDQMPATLLKMAGYSDLPVTASSTVVWGQSKLWVALVLDNSGSMSPEQFQRLQDDGAEERLRAAC